MLLLVPHPYYCRYGRTAVLSNTEGRRQQREKKYGAVPHANCTEAGQDRQLAIVGCVCQGERQGYAPNGWLLRVLLLRERPFPNGPMTVRI